MMEILRIPFLATLIICFSVTAGGTVETNSILDALKLVFQCPVPDDVAITKGNGPTVRVLFHTKVGISSTDNEHFEFVQVNETIDSDEDVHNVNHGLKKDVVTTTSSFKLSDLKSASTTITKPFKKENIYLQVFCKSGKCARLSVEYCFAHEKCKVEVTKWRYATVQICDAQSAADGVKLFQMLLKPQP